MTMTVSNHQIVEYVYDHMNEIKWREFESGGFVGSFNNATIHITASEFARATLTISADHEQYVIVEPQPLCDAPLGKWIKSFKKHILRQEIQPPDSKTQAALHLKRRLCDIMACANEQVMNRYKDPQGERKLRRRIWDKLTGEQDL